MKRKVIELSSCPWCGGMLVLKVNNSEQSIFIGCSKFPFCNYTRNDVNSFSTGGNYVYKKKVVYFKDFGE
ncbi:topoisomerase DNA-binding C4 zinc finger domain-containing protein [Oceanobacillus polygoni]|uniref:topoisomerase DNA-binding C4 zinc finger domain-containing protein n=1 Tax=Oceanobacillus polygoni TaxID=1235259 RepID=UPI0011F201BB